MSLDSRRKLAAERARLYGRTSDTTGGYARAGRRLSLLTLTALAALLTGCARSVVTTTVNADGSMSRKSQFKMIDLDLGGLMPGGNGPKGGPITVAAPPASDAKLDLGTFFALPKGAGWTVSKSKDKNEVVYTASRTAAKGEAIKQDIAVLGGENQKQVVLVNEATVREVAPGRLEYREVLHWQGKKTTDYTLNDKDLIEYIRSALPSALATPAAISDLANVIQRGMAHLIFGPNQPMLMQFMIEVITFPEVAQYRLTKSIGADLDQELQNRFGAKLTPDQRYAITQKIISNALSALKETAKSKSSPDNLMGGGKEKENAPGAKDKNGDSPVGMTFLVKLPGKIVATNGEADNYNHQVFWALYSTSASYGDVVLTATCEVK